MKNSYKKNKYRDVLIVLGCAIFVRGVPRIMAERVRRAISVFRSGDYSLLILSGGPTKTPIPEAELMKLMAEKHISPKKIILEPVSVDTVQNAVFCWGLLKGKPVASITVVTSYFHMRRAKHIFSSVFALSYSPNFSRNTTFLSNDFVINFLFFILNIEVGSKSS